MPDNFAALVAAGVFRIVSLTRGEGNHFAGVGSQRADPKPIILNLPSGTSWVGVQETVQGYDFYRFWGRLVETEKGSRYLVTRVEAELETPDSGDAADAVVGHNLWAYSGEDPLRPSERWTVTYRAPQDAYTIESENNLRWAVSAATEVNGRPRIMLESIARPNGPYLDSQLFRFQPVPVPVDD